MHLAQAGCGEGLRLELGKALLRPAPQFLAQQLNDVGAVERRCGLVMALGQTLTQPRGQDTQIQAQQLRSLEARALELVEGLEQDVAQLGLMGLLVRRRAQAALGAMHQLGRPQTQGSTGGDAAAGEPAGLHALTKPDRWASPKPRQTVEDHHTKGVSCPGASQASGSGPKPRSR